MTTMSTSTVAHRDPTLVTKFERHLSQASRSATVTVLRAHPEWTVSDLARLLETDRADMIGTITLGEILEAVTDVPHEAPIDRARLAAAKRAKGDSYDALVLEAVTEARSPVGAGYLRPRVGGPRWKLGQSLGRLVRAGKVVKSGTTSGTRYTAAGEPR